MTPSIHRRLLSTAVAIFLMAIALPVHAADGGLDPQFGAAGKVTTDFLGQPLGSGGHDRASAIALQADGRIVTAGIVDSASGDLIMALIRYNADGTLDSTFGSGGKVALDFFNWNYTPSEREGIALAVQADGRIVLAGTVGVPNTASDFGVARFNADGSLDGTFGGGAGWVTTDFGNPGDQYPTGDGATSVAIQADGRIVAAGFARINGGYNDFAIARYNPDGTLDSTFGGGTGKLTVDFEGTDDWANGVAIQADGKIVAAGVASDPNYKRAFGLVRVGPDGTLDPGFGSGANGRVRTTFYEWDEANALAIQPSDGRIVVAGFTYINVVGLPVTYFDFALARYDTTGALDGGFGAGGKVTTDIAGGFDIARAIAIQADGKIVVAGLHADVANVELLGDFAIARYTDAGVPDAGFGSGGQVTTAFDGYDAAQAVAIQSDCKIVAAGYSWVTEATEWGLQFSYDSNFALARYDGGTCTTPPPAPRCPLSQGYWNSHPSSWPLQSLTLGNQTYSKDELRLILAAATTGDASVVLAQQLITVKLNLANGSDPAPIIATVVHADALLGGFVGKLPYKVKSSSSLGGAMTTDGRTLESYNTGLLTPACAP